ncbi:unnamed protein product [Caretta caretta]
MYGDIPAPEDGFLSYPLSLLLSGLSILRDVYTPEDEPLLLLQEKPFPHPSDRGPPVSTVPPFLMEPSSNSKESPDIVPPTSLPACRSLDRHPRHPDQPGYDPLRRPLVPLPVGSTQNDGPWVLLEPLGPIAQMYNAIAGVLSFLPNVPTSSFSVQGGRHGIGTTGTTASFMIHLVNVP